VTVNDAIESLFNWFSDHDTFQMERDFKELVVITDNMDEEKCAISCALKDMESNNIISSHTTNKTDYYILCRKLQAFSQDVSIDGDTAWAIAGVINGVCDALNDHVDECNPVSLKPLDIKNITFIAMEELRKASEVGENNP
jgi:hypothetical protein